MTEVKQWITALDSDKPVVIVTHRVNITALTEKYSSSGEMIVVQLKGGELEVIGTMEAAL